MRYTLGLLAACTLALAACSSEPEPAGEATGAAEAVVPETKALPDLLDDADGMQVVAEGLKETGIAGIFQGKASYTLLAPEDDAFEGAGESAKELTRSQDHAALAALLKDHLIPGYMTPQDISAAIDASKDQQVSMTTVSGRQLTFTKADGVISISAPDGALAKVDGKALAGGASVAIPVSGILKKI